MKKYYNPTKDNGGDPIKELAERNIADELTKAAKFLIQETKAANAAQNARIEGKDPDEAAAKIRGAKDVDPIEEQRKETERISGFHLLQNGESIGLFIV